MCEKHFKDLIMSRWGEGGKIFYINNIIDLAIFLRRVVAKVASQDVKGDLWIKAQGSSFPHSECRREYKVTQAVTLYLLSQDT